MALEEAGDQKARAPPTLMVLKSIDQEARVKRKGDQEAAQAQTRIVRPPRRERSGTIGI